MKKIYTLFGICGILISAIVFTTIESASSGVEINNLQKKETTLLSERQALEEGLVENLSVSSLQVKSTEMGFSKVNNLVYVGHAISEVAKLP